MTRVKRVAALVPLLAGSLALLSGALSGLAGPADSLTIQEANKHKVLMLQEGTEPRTLDPQLEQGVPEHHTIMALIEGLVGEGLKSSSDCVPGMADRWEHNDDFSVWTFHIGEDRKWSNGDPVTAHDFVFSYKRLLTASFGAPFAEYLFVLKGAEDYYRGKIKDFDKVGVKALDDHLLRLEFVGPTPYLLSLVRHSSWFPVHPKTILKFGRMDERDTKWTKVGNFVGNGPFILKSWYPNDVIETVRNPLYWDAANVKLNGINFYSIENLDTAERAFQAGQLHKILQIPLDKVVYYRTKYPQLTRIDPYNGVYYYRLNVERKPLDNPKVRLALNLAIDREALVKNVLRAGQKPATGFTPPGMDDYQVLDKIRYNPDKARQLLAEAGYPDGKGFPKLSLLFNTLESHRTVAEAIQQMWKSELNIDIALENQEWKVFQDTMNKIDFDICRYGWIGDYMDPVTFLNIWTTGNGNNNTHWSNPEYDHLISLAARTGDPKARFDILHEAEDLFLNEPPIVLLYWYTNFYLLQPSVKNWYPLVLDNHNYKFIDLEASPEATK